METNKSPFKDVASQAVEIILSRFREQNKMPSVSVNWIDRECGLADINNGLLTIQFAELIAAVRNNIPIQELTDWQDYNARLCNVGLESYIIPVEKWMNYSTVKLSDLELRHIEETMAAKNATKKQYDDFTFEAIKKLSPQN